MSKPEFNFTVNDHDVPWPGSDHKATGGEVKGAAIAAGVPIEQDYLLNMETKRGTFTAVDDGEEVRISSTSVFVAVEPDFNITVNNKSVPWPKQDRRATGLEVKAAAIAAGVEIQLDFLLSAKNRRGIFDPVLDDEVVRLQDNKVFRAVGPDDNS